MKYEIHLDMHLSPKVWSGVILELSKVVLFLRHNRCLGCLHVNHPINVSDSFLFSLIWKTDSPHHLDKSRPLILNYVKTRRRPEHAKPPIMTSLNFIIQKRVIDETMITRPPCSTQSNCCCYYATIRLRDVSFFCTDKCYRKHDLLGRGKRRSCISVLQCEWQKKWERNWGRERKSWLKRREAVSEEGKRQKNEEERGHRWWWMKGKGAVTDQYWKPVLL